MVKSRLNRGVVPFSSAALQFSSGSPQLYSPALLVSDALLPEITIQCYEGIQI